MRRKMSGRKINPWKWAFLMMLALQLALIVILWLRISKPREENLSLPSKESEFVQVGSFSATREELNEAMEGYLKDYQSGNFSYKVYATQTQVVFEGDYDILNGSVPLYIYFTPSKDKNGSIVLDIEEVSAGTLSLPTSEVLKYVNKNYKFPKFIKVDAKSGKIFLDLKNFPNKLGLAVEARTLDLYHNQLIFDIFLKNH